ncbi:glycosyltransferase 87 family protein [Actinomadura sp. ATCC 31491]|uniref:Glycosyltransferase 87 family protein n=1 Tax=Actinomadura luzonensis TaxID=2805427 RepID=A0ABT0FPD0_9ACTN|nr:glycosyltransferase 87 family protein [Actinomadura luzonensis]MCK2214208.1 glycosyltransferase 87 family protein [Actinomadura luzonensis]
MTSVVARVPLAARAVPFLPLGLIAALGASLAYVVRLPCRTGGWNDQVSTYTNFCYTDIYPLFFDRSLSTENPYFAQVPFDKQVEYPVVLGEVMQVISWVVRWAERDVVGQAVKFYDLTVILLGLCLVAGVLLMAAVAGPTRRWDALWYAISPAVVLAAYINWDLVAGALSMGMLLAWARKRQVLAGVLLGLAIATKFYPLMFAGALFLLTLRTAKWRPFLVTIGSAAGAWIAVNAPFMIFAFEGWRRFYVFSAERGIDWGSPWLFFQNKGWPILGEKDVSMLGTVSLALLCVGIAVLALAAPRRPRLAQLCFLALAAFMMTNKVWSPQFVLWLVPFAVLARPNWKPLVLWQLAEVWYFAAIWLYLLSQPPLSRDDLGIGDDTYFTAVWGRIITIGIMMAFVVRDVLRPDKDVVRQAELDDQAGGVFDGAPDRVTLATVLR